MTDIAAELKAVASDAKAWPFAEARDLAKRLDGMGHQGEVLFETGYGPSGLPHIGTFGEVVRTSMVRHAFEVMTGAKTRLVCFSDDMDGLRKVPDNIPNGEAMKADLGLPLTAVRDPFGTHPSFGAHNNARLQAFLDSFGFDYEFVSSTDCYRSGWFDDGLRAVLANYDKIMGIMLPTLGEERRATYSPFFPVCPQTGHVLQAKVVATDVARDAITYLHPESGAEIETSVLGGACKLQWKADWAMRWFVLGVDYEMAGKDLIDSVRQSSKITRAIGGNPPIGISYELFLDAAGEKISKSKGNGLSVEEWLRYGSPESLALFMYAQPRRAKRLHF
ncbi:MAG: lysine--tRNA ligase, partial [Pseudomonadota bacterium]|nr:lysine--tRNA ligase [Pseudomonadota bacterium]